MWVLRMDFILRSEPLPSLQRPSQPIREDLLGVRHPSSVLILMKRKRGGAAKALCGDAQATHTSCHQVISKAGRGLKRATGGGADRALGSVRPICYSISGFLNTCPEARAMATVSWRGNY